MDTPTLPTSITRLAAAWREGAGGAGDALARRVYRELHAIAVRHLLKAADPGLQPTELVNEAWIRLSRGGRRFESRDHFYAIAALQMRHLLVDLARMRDAQKRQGRATTLTVQIADGEPQPADLVVVAEAIDQLADLDARKAQAFALVELVGFGIVEAARILAVSTATLERDLRFSRVWLAARLRPC
ncbi:ECF-type sigma factor [Coralloluteibacterium thermophilus]|uniref:ECF-type sigma factor n=1 Tax=Coralloluteibacterium thermophilum TaxID=2707049 RepID=A0ABV9NN76_9GAMM